MPPPLEFATHLSWLAAWFWLLVLIGLIWLRRHLEINRAGEHPPLDPAAEVGDATDLSPLTVLVAAKDEEANIGHCLTGLLAQEYPNLEIIAINDRSGDRTGALLDEFAARDARLRAVHVTELPPGWAGKNHAMHQGVQHATGEYLCFTDADCRYHDPRLLAAAVRYARRTQIDLLSVLPDLEAHTFWERVVQPPAGGIMVFWFPPQKVNSPRSGRAYANGAFMLLPRAAYERLGGHAAVPMALNEDMHFARLVKAAGMRLWVMRGGGTYSVRMYVGLPQIWRGWSRIFYAAFGTLPRLLLSIAFLAVFSLSPYVSLLAAPFVGGAGLGLALAALWACVAQQTVLWRFYRLSNTSGPWALTWPLGTALCLAMMGNALTRHFGVKTRWRGTLYRGGS